MKKIALLLLLILVGCQSKTQPDHLNKESTQTTNHFRVVTKIVPSSTDSTFKIINLVVSDLINTPKVQEIVDSLQPINSNQLTLFPSHILYSADSFVIEQFIAAGVSTELRQFAKMKSKTFDNRMISDVDSIEVTFWYPLTTADQKRNIGGFNLSRIVYSKKTSEAWILVHFERFHDERTKLFCAYHLKINHANWSIVSKVCL